jgi:4-hydroxyphenylpyruvate dioxygenase-like putative hemolysin
MSARESWTKRRAQRTDRGETPSRTPAVTGPMNARHRCDRCGAQAYVRIILRNRQDLLFCAHHYRQHEPTLAKVAVAIQDETQRLTRG